MKLCVALDMQNKQNCLNLARDLAGLPLWLKVGMRAYYRDGAEFLRELKQISDFKIFLDLKLYDIPNTMADASEVIANTGVDMINLHASSGKIAMQCVIDRLNALPKRPLVLGVTALTSFDDENFAQIYNANINETANKFAKFCYESGLDGVVCSVFESKAIKMATNDKFLTLTPGIRPFGESVGDQKRVANIESAKAQKSDFIVVGRPIYQDKDPKGVVMKILEQI